MRKITRTSDGYYHLAFTLSELTYLSAMIMLASKTTRNPRTLAKTVEFKFQIDPVIEIDGDVDDSVPIPPAQSRS